MKEVNKKMSDTEKMSLLMALTGVIMLIASGLCLLLVVV